MRRCASHASGHISDCHLYQRVAHDGDLRPLVCSLGRDGQPSRRIWTPGRYWRADRHGLRDRRLLSAHNADFRVGCTVAAGIGSLGPCFGSRCFRGCCRRRFRSHHRSSGHRFRVDRTTCIEARCDRRSVRPGSGYRKCGNWNCGSGGWSRAYDGYLCCTGHGVNCCSGIGRRESRCRCRVGHARLLVRPPQMGRCKRTKRLGFPAGNASFLRKQEPRNPSQL